jgi:toxin FitB
VNGFLIDTNVISEFVKPQPEERVIRWLNDADPESLFVSVVTFGEIRLGIENMPHGKRRAALEDWVEHQLPAWFDSNLLPVTRPIADHWARLTIATKSAGGRIAMADGLIAATAIAHGLAIVTRNIGDFVNSGVAIVNPWEL